MRTWIEHAWPPSPKQKQTRIRYQIDDAPASKEIFRHRLNNVTCPIMDIRTKIEHMNT